MVDPWIVSPRVPNFWPFHVELFPEPRPLARNLPDGRVIAASYRVAVGSHDYGYMACFSPRWLVWFARLWCWFRTRYPVGTLRWLADHYLLRVDEGGIMLWRNVTPFWWIERRRRRA